MKKKIDKIPVLDEDDRSCCCGCLLMIILIVFLWGAAAIASWIFFTVGAGC